MAYLEENVSGGIRKAKKEVKKEKKEKKKPGSEAAGLLRVLFTDGRGSPARVWYTRA